MATLQARFAEMLQRDLGQLTQLEVVLGQEHEALKLRDSAQITQNSEAKQQLILAIETLGRERMALLQGAEQGTDKEAVLAFVDAEPQLRSHWDELVALLLRCQKQNQINGMLLEKGKQQTQQLLGILLGEGTRKDPEKMARFVSAVRAAENFD